jgi:hypothetical protein
MLSRSSEPAIVQNKLSLSQKEEKTLIVAFKLYGSNWHSIATALPPMYCVYST